MKKVSIIIPAKNEEKTIGELLNKINSIKLNQINFEKEIIVVDDGSDDNTSKICEKYKNIILIKQKNMGKGRAVQNGIKYSTGDYVLIQDADLEYDPNYYVQLLEPFIHYEFNEKPMGEVMEMHRKSLDDIDWDLVPEGFSDASYSSWDSAIGEIKKNGARNAQTTLLAPTGTIKYLMGCDTTGVEPEIALSIKKDLAGGGTITLANNGVTNSLENLGYGPEESNEISNFIATNNHVIGAPHLNPDHYSVFATAFGNEDGIGSISLEGHVKMLGAVQPFLSGGISKTNNLPESSTVSEVYDAFILGHDLGLKGLTTFRTNSKPTAALNFGSKSVVELKRGEKEDLPERRIATEFEVEIGGTPLHVVSSEYSNGRPGQITFLSYKAGSTLGSLLTTAGVAASKSLKRGVSLEDVTEGWLGHEFEPNGLVRGHPHIKTAKSPLDFAAKLLRLEYLGETDFATTPEEVNIESLRGFENGGQVSVTGQGHFRIQRFLHCLQVVRNPSVMSHQIDRIPTELRRIGWDPSVAFSDRILAATFGVKRQIDRRLVSYRISTIPHRI